MTIEEARGLVELGLNDLREKMIKEANKTNLGAGDAVDLASSAIQISQIDQGMENVKKHIFARLK